MITRSGLTVPCASETDGVAFTIGRFHNLVFQRLRRAFGYASFLFYFLFFGCT